MELELKLLLDPAVRSVVESHQAFAAVGSEEREETTTYFDTPDLCLRQRGASLRVRRSGPHFVQTVKLAEPGAGLGVRGEWEWPLESAKLDPTRLAELPRGAALPGEIIDRVGPLFSTKIKRKVWCLELDEATRVEAVIDEGVVRARRRQAPISEVELELKGGPSGPLFRLAIELAERAALRYGSQSKAERGYGLVSADLAPHRKPAPIALAKGVTVGIAFPHLLNAALQGLAAEIPAAAAGEIEGVHRLRAAIRKLRTLLVFFGPHLDEAASRRFNIALREIGAVLGEGRDWDVFLVDTLPKAGKEAGGAAVKLLAGPAETRRRAAQARIEDLMRGPKPTELILGMGAWAAEPGWLRGADPEARLIDRLPDLMHRLARKVRKRAKHVPTGSLEDLHDLRKALKKLRYAAEDVGTLFADKAVHRYLGKIKSVLGLLGEINDAAVTVRRVDEVAPQDRPGLASAAATVLAWNEARRVAAMDALKSKLRKFRAVEPFWE